MLKTLSVALICLLFAPLSLSGEVQLKDNRRHVLETKAVCIKGYMFAVVVSPEGYGWNRPVSLTQIYRDGGPGDTNPQPMKCDK